METQLLRDINEAPEESVIKAALGRNYAVYSDFTKRIKGSLDISNEWNYYKDGKAWLSKNSYKKKTVFWLSVWEGFFRISFYFSAKTRGGVLTLALDDSIKESFSSAKAVGKLIPLVVDVKSKEQFKDLIKIISYKIATL